jgi:hypothetical protein
VRYNCRLVDVFFDDFKVTHVKSHIVEAQDFYPFGLTLTPIRERIVFLTVGSFRGRSTLTILG